MRLLLTGPPGIGKTTICKQVASSTSLQNYTLHGFYTEEVRNASRKRIGFDIVDIKDSENRAPLARIGDVLEAKEFQKHKIGNYHVFTENVDQVALPTLCCNTQILIIDEIGKMELFSNNFLAAMKELLIAKQPNVPCIVATIPLAEKIPQRHAAFFDQLRQNPMNSIIKVDYNNRNNLPMEICGKIIKTLGN